MKRSEIWYWLWFASLAICPVGMGLLAWLCHEPRGVLLATDRSTPWADSAVTILVYAHWGLSLMAAITAPWLARGWGERLVVWLGIALWGWGVNCIAFGAALSVNAMTG